MTAVAGVCPSCGGERLQVDSGRIVCIEPLCLRPLAITELISEPAGEHVVRTDGWNATVRHPLIERIDGGLFACDVLDAIDDTRLPRGEYLARPDPTGVGWAFTPVRGRPS